MELQRLRAASPGGWQLDVVVAGPEGGVPVVYHLGTPFAGDPLTGWVEAGIERGLRHVLYSRPGYGDSDRHEGRSVADCVPDVEAVTAALGIDRFHTVGWSGGGPHALACAALLPGRVISAATIGGVAPWEAEGLDWLAGMGPENLEELGAAAAGPAEVQAYLEGQEPELKEISGSELVGALGGLLTETDTRVLTGELGDFLAAGTREALRNGIWGWLDDDLAFVRPWGVDLAEIEVPVTIWQGGEDRFVPFSHGEWLAAHVQGATARLLPEEGHLSLLVSSYDRVLDGLLEGGSQGRL